MKEASLMAQSSNSPTASTGAEQSEESPGASAFLVVSPMQVQAGAKVPAPQALTMITIFASLTGLAIMGVLAPAVTLNQAPKVLTPGWIVFFLILEYVLAAVVTIFPYTARQ
jgi:hypothetical protein